MPATSLDELRRAITDKLAELLKDDEAGWYQAASWIDKRALEEGIDLWVDFASHTAFADSLVDGMRFHTNFEQRFPNGISDLEQFAVAEEPFWHLMPRSDTRRII